MTTTSTSKNTERVRVSLDLSSTVNDLLEEIASEEGITKSELFRRAISLVKVAHDAKREGQSLGVLDSDGRPLMQIVGV